MNKPVIVLPPGLVSLFRAEFGDRDYKVIVMDRLPKTKPPGARRFRRQKLSFQPRSKRK